MTKSKCCVVRFAFCRRALPGSLWSWTAQNGRLTVVLNRTSAVHLTRPRCPPLLMGGDVVRRSSAAWRGESVDQIRSPKSQFRNPA